MRALRSCFVLLGTLALAGMPTRASAQPVGSEFQVNTYTTGSQTLNYAGGRRAVAADPNGNFVVVWASDKQDGSNYGVFGRRYDSAGNRLGAEFRVNSFTTGVQANPVVATDAAGNFVVVWNSGLKDGSQTGVFGQRFNSAGNKVGGEFQVNSYTSGAQSYPAVAFDASGNFIVVWRSDGQDGDKTGIFGQRYNSSGQRRGGEFQVSTFTLNSQSDAAIASDASGNFVVVWQSLGQDGSSWGVFGQRYDDQGGPLGAEFPVNTYTPYYQFAPAVASDAAGNFVVVWSGLWGNGSYYSDIWGQRYDSQGDPLGAEFRISDSQWRYKGNSSVSFDPAGNFVVVWDNGSYVHPPPYNAGYGVFGKRYDSSGAPVTFEFQINSYTTYDQAVPSVANTGTNQFVVVWQSGDWFGDGNQDGSSWGVFGQRFDFSEEPTIHVGDLDRRAKNVGASWRAQVKTLVHDDSHGPVVGAVVLLDVSGVGLRGCTTTAGGTCEVSVTVSDSVPSLTFTVTSLSKTGFGYDSGANHDPDPDSDGTVIVVNQP